MKLLGFESICCGDGVKGRFQKVGSWAKLSKEGKDKAVDEGIYICLKCKKPTDAFFKVEMNKEDMALFNL